jgi:hypothetical protein
MNDDDFSNIVRSGSGHRVSVSERTGNAKTPKNIVVSDENETEARKRAFEQKTLEALEGQKALSDVLAEHAEQDLPNDGAQDANIQKVADNKTADNLQTIVGDGPTKPNVQNVSTDVLEANKQQVSADIIQDNIQAIGNNKGMAANVQNISADVIAANVQIISNGNIAANTQNIVGEKAIETNRQGNSTDVIAPNVQNIPVGNIAANVQDISGKSVSANNQAIPQENTSLNHQSLDLGLTNSSELQDLPQTHTSSNRQVLSGNDNRPNNANIAPSTSSNNGQTIDKPGIQDNKQSLDQDKLVDNNQPLAPTPGIPPNIQGVGHDAPSLNRQSTPQATQPDPNRQGVDNSKIQSHFEKAQTGSLERKKVDFSTPADNRSSPSSLNKAGRAQTPPIATGQQQASLNRLNAKDAFHGRLAGIKQNVDALNNRLADLEEKALTDDAKLEKDNP